MELKKSKAANLENKKIIFFQVSLIITLAFMLSAFEWSSTAEKSNQFANQEVSEEVEEEMINTFQQENVPPPPPPKPQVIEVFDIVEDDIEIEDVELEDMDVDVDDEVAVQTIEEEEEEEASDEIFFIVENMPEFPGGENEMRRFIAKNVVYPDIAVENGISGKVIVSFVVNKTGKPTNIKIVRGVDPLLDKEAKTVITKMPNFKPGLQRGKPVNVSYIVPVSFALE
jgi:protein TonB